MASIRKHAGKKYIRRIYSCVADKDGNFPSIEIDVYCVLEAFDVRCSPSQHIIKKILCAGLRSKGSALQDLDEAVNSSGPRAIEMQRIRETKGKRKCSSQSRKKPSSS